VSKSTACKIAAALRVYLYAAVSTLSVMWLHGVHDWKSIALAVLSALLAPVTQALNPKDHTLGIGSKKR